MWLTLMRWRVARANDRREHGWNVRPNVKSTWSSAWPMLMNYEYSPPEWWFRKADRRSLSNYLCLDALDASSSSHILTDWVASLRSIKNVKIAVRDSRVVKSSVFGAACVPPLTLDQILLELYLLCPPPTLLPPSISTTVWSGVDFPLSLWY